MITKETVNGHELQHNPFEEGSFILISADKKTTIRFSGNDYQNSKESKEAAVKVANLI